MDILKEIEDVQAELELYKAQLDPLSDHKSTKIRDIKQSRLAFLQQQIEDYTEKTHELESDTKAVEKATEDSRKGRLDRDKASSQNSRKEHVLEWLTYLTDISVQSWNMSNGLMVLKFLPIVPDAKAVDIEIKLNMKQNFRTIQYVRAKNEKINEKIKKNNEVLKLIRTSDLAMLHYHIQAIIYPHK